MSFHRHSRAERKGRDRSRPKTAKLVERETDRGISGVTLVIVKRQTLLYESTRIDSEKLVKRRIGVVDPLCIKIVPFW